MKEHRWGVEQLQVKNFVRILQHSDRC